MPHSLSESPAPETAEERQSSSSAEVTEENKVKPSPADEISHSDPLQAEDPAAEEVHSTGLIEAEPKDEPAKPEGTPEPEPIPSGGVPPSDLLQAPEPVEDTQNDLPLSDSTTSNDIVASTPEPERPESAVVEVVVKVEEVSNSYPQEDSPEVKEGNASPVNTSEDNQEKADETIKVKEKIEEKVETKAEVVDSEPIGHGHAEVQEITVPVLTPTAELSPAVDVEGLQKRLKLVEQRFAGMRIQHLPIYRSK